MIAVAEAFWAFQRSSLHRFYPWWHIVRQVLIICDGTESSQNKTTYSRNVNHPKWNANKLSKNNSFFDSQVRFRDRTFQYWKAFIHPTRLKVLWKSKQRKLMHESLENLVAHHHVGCFTLGEYVVLLLLLSVPPQVMRTCRAICHHGQKWCMELRGNAQYASATAIILLH